MRRLRWLAALGIAGSVISVVADAFLGYYPQAVHAFETVFTLDLDTVYPIFVDATHTRLVLSNYLAAIGIPMGWFGLYYVVQQLDRGGRAGWLSRLALWGGAVGYVGGLLFHVSLSYVATAIRLRAGAEEPLAASLTHAIDLFGDFSQPLAYLFLAASFLISAIYFGLVATGRSRFPRWAAAVNPLTLQLLIGAMAAVMPLSVRTLLVVSVYNLSLAVFYAFAYLVPKRETRASSGT